MITDPQLFQTTAAAIGIVVVVALVVLAVILDVCDRRTMKRFERANARWFGEVARKNQAVRNR